MGEVIPQHHLRWTFATSAFLHAGVALVLILNIKAASTVVPIGVEMIYLGEAKSSAGFVAKAAPAAAPTIKRQKAEIATRIQPVVQETVASTGTGEGAERSGVSGARDGAVVSALERYKFELRLFLESRKIYPETAKRLRQMGTVVVQFKVGPTGELSDVNVERPSSSEILNRSAQDLVKSAQRFKPIPSEANASELHLSLPIEYIL